MILPRGRDNKEFDEEIYVELSKRHDESGTVYESFSARLSRQELNEWLVVYTFK